MFFALWNQWKKNNQIKFDELLDQLLITPEYKAAFQE